VFGWLQSQSEVMKVCHHICLQPHSIQYNHVHQHLVCNLLLSLLLLQLPSVDSVEYWRSPDKAGWLQSQSEVMKMWRRRWFVLKQGYLFRFLSPDVSGEQQQLQQQQIKH
jgi:hypothetical protein